MTLFFLIDNFINYLETEKRFSDHTVVAYKKDIEQFISFSEIKTAKEIVELRQSLPGEKFIKLDQLNSIKRVDWDEVFATGSVYVE